MRRITVLRNGRLMKTGGDRIRSDRLIRLMIGDDLARTRRRPAQPASPAPRFPCCASTTSAWATSSQHVVFDIPGEITGVAGLIGSGRSEVAKVIMGHTKRNFGGGQIWLEGREVRYSLPAQAVAAGLAYVCEIASSTVSSR